MTSTPSTPKPRSHRHRRHRRGVRAGKIAPRVASLRRGREAPRRPPAGDGGARLLRRGRRRVGGAGSGWTTRPSPRLIEEVSKTCQSWALSRCRPGWSVRGCSGSAPPDSASGGSARWPRATSSAPPGDRARLGRRRRRDANHLYAGRRRIRDQRGEGVDLQPRISSFLSPSPPATAPDARRDHRLHHPPRYARPRPPPLQEQARLPAPVHRRRVLHRPPRLPRRALGIEGDGFEVR